MADVDQPPAGGRLRIESVEERCSAKPPHEPRGDRILEGSNDLGEKPQERFHDHFESCAAFSTAITVADSWSTSAPAGIAFVVD